MFALMHGRLRREDGISLVETLVSILLVGVVLLALGSTLTASMAVARESEALTQATALGNQRLEALQRLPWAQAGLYSSEPGYAQAVTLGAPYTTVDLGAAPALRPAGVPLPIETVTFGGRQYEVTTAVVYRCAVAAEPACGSTATYRQFIQRLTWNNGVNSLTVEARRSLNSFSGSGSGGGSGGMVLDDPFRIVSFNVAPDPVRLRSNDNRLAENMVIEVETSHDASGAQISAAAWTTPQTMTQIEPRLFRLTVVAPTSAYGQAPGFAYGSYPFSVTATRQGGGTASSMAEAFFIYPLVRTALNWDSNLNRLWTGTAGPTGDRLCMDATTSRLRNNNVFTVTYQGLGPSDWVRLERTSGTAWTYNFTPAPSPAGNTTFTLTLTAANAGNFSGNSASFVLRATRTYDNIAQDLSLPMHISYLNGNNPC